MDIFSFAQDVWDGFVYLFYACFDWVLSGILLCVGYPLYYIFKGFLTAVNVLLLSVDLTRYVTNMISELAGLPPALLYLLNNCGINEGLTLIFGAIAIRMLLNLIPAALTRI